MKGWKTVAFGVIVAAITMLSGQEFQAFLGDHIPWLGALTGTIIVVLRALTTSPIFKK